MGWHLTVQHHARLPRVALGCVWSLGTTKQQQEVQMSPETCKVSICVNSSAQVHRQGNPFAFLCRSVFLVKPHIGENNCCDLLDSYKETVVSLGSCGSTVTLHPLPHSAAQLAPLKSHVKLKLPFMGRFPEGLYRS